MIFAKKIPVLTVISVSYTHLDVYKRQFRLRMNLPTLSSGHGADNDPIDSGKVN